MSRKSNNEILRRIVMAESNGKCCNHKSIAGSNIYKGRCGFSGRIHSAVDNRGPGNKFFERKENIKKVRNGKRMRRMILMIKNPMPKWNKSVRIARRERCEIDVEGSGRML